MAFRDRFYTPQTARALLSWRLAVGAAIAIGLALVGVNPVVASLAGLAVYSGFVYAAMPKGVRRANIDPFALSEPWRQFMQGAQRSRRELAEAVRSANAGPMRDRLADIADRLERAIGESWEIAKRGHVIDAAVKRIDPVRLRSRLDTLKQQDDDATTPDDGGDDATSAHDVRAAVASVESQLESADRLKQLSTSTAARLRLTQARFDELVARAAEVTVGASDTDSYAHDVDSLVIELEALRLAVAEVDGASSPPSEGTGQLGSGQTG